MTDRESDTIRTTIAKKTAQFLAEVVDQHVDPLAYDHVHQVGSRRYRVTVARYKGDEVDRRLEQVTNPKP